jgi:hypothetical protein
MDWQARDQSRSPSPAPGAGWLSSSPPRRLLSWALL